MSAQSAAADGAPAAAGTAAVPLSAMAETLQSAARLGAVRAAATDLGAKKSGKKGARPTAQKDAGAQAATGEPAQAPGPKGVTKKAKKKERVLTLSESRAAALQRAVGKKRSKKDKPVGVAGVVYGRDTHGVDALAAFRKSQA